ncbi:hypothetical protein ACSSS7_002353 [Eimeria intestinalis]
MEPEEMTSIAGSSNSSNSSSSKAAAKAVAAAAAETKQQQRFSVESQINSFPAKFDEKRHSSQTESYTKVPNPLQDKP